MSGILAAYTLAAGTFELDLSGKASPNIASLLSAGGWNTSDRVHLIVRPSQLLNTLVIPSMNFPMGVRLIIGAGAVVGGVRGATGPGGTAIRTEVPIEIDNGGAIYGGGGEGGPGGYVYFKRSTGPDADVMFYAYGGAGGAGQGFDSASVMTVSADAYGAGGSTAFARPSGFGGGDAGTTGTGGNGGRGGAWGVGGSRGADAALTGEHSYAEWPSYTHSNGHPAGYYIDGNALVTWINTGTRAGRVK